MTELGQPLLATRAHVARACRYMARRIFLNDNLALDVLEFRWEAGLYIHRQQKTFATGTMLLCWLVTFCNKSDRVPP